MSGDTPDPARDRERFAKRLQEAGLNDRRNINVLDGEKGTRTPGHQEPDNWLAPDDPALSGNYGVHPGAGADGGVYLVEFDIDDYDDVEDTDALDELPETFGVESPHTPDGKAGHYYYRVEADDIAVLKDLTGTLNPEPAWGEIKAAGKYVVGPGSQLDGCSKEWCDECDKPDGGYYRIANDVPIATLTREQLAEVIRADADLGNGTLGDTSENEADEAADADENPGFETEGSPSDDAPDAMPACYRRALETRADPRQATVNEYEVSKHAALLGLWAGYDADDVVDHMTREFAPGEHASIGLDQDVTRYQVEKLETKTEQERPLRPPSAETLQRDGILPGSAGDCAPGCPIHSTASADGGTAAASASAGGAGNDKEDSGTVSPSTIKEKGGGYGYWNEDDDGEWYFAEATNFTLETNAVLDLRDETYLDLDVVPAYGERYQTQVQPTVFNEWRDFKKELVTGIETVVSAPRKKQQILNDLRLLVAGQDAPRLVGVKRLGVHDDEFVTPDGVLTADGWADHPEHVFIDDGNPLVTALDIADDGDVSSVARALELLPQSRDPELFIPVIGWFYATAFRPAIRDMTGQFNHLAVFGETGAGKTMTTSILSQMFGMGTNGFNPLDTAFVSLRTLSAGRGVPLWYDEYKPAEWSERGRRQFHADLRKAAAGQWARRGNADKSTEGFFLSAPVVLTGEQHLQGSAEQRRTIQTKFSTDATLGEACQNAYYELRDECDLRGHARLFYEWMLRQDDDEVRESWASAGEKIAEKLPVSEIDDMAQQGLQTVLFGMDVYQNFAESVGASPPDLPVWESLKRLCGDTGADARTSHIEEFVTLLGRAAVNGYLEKDAHYTFTNDELRVNVARSHDRVSKFIRDHDLTGVDLFNNAGDYTARFRDSGADWITCVGQKSPPVSRAVGIDLDACPFIDRSAVTDDESGDDDGENGITPIEDLSLGYTTLTARVNNVERPTPDKAPTQAGRLVDQTGAVNFVSWGESPFNLTPDEHYRFANAEVGEYKSETQVELVDGVTKVEPIAAGVGHTEGPGEPLQGERLRTVKMVIEDICECDDGAEHARVDDIVDDLAESDIPPEKTQHALDKLRQQGTIYEPETGQYRVR